MVQPIRVSFARLHILTPDKTYSLNSRRPSSSASVIDTRINCRVVVHVQGNIVFINQNFVVLIESRVVLFKEQIVIIFYTGPSARLRVRQCICLPTGVILGLGYLEEGEV